VRLADVIEALKDTYNSIDIRVFCFIQDNAWKNVFTIIRFRRETVAELKIQHERLLEKCGGLVQTPEYRVGLFQFPIERWQKITEDLSNKFLCLTDSFAVNYFDSIHLNHSVTEPYSNRNDDFVFKSWKVFSGYSETNNSSRPSYHEKLFDVSLEKQLSNFDDYLSGTLEFNKFFFQRNPWVYIYVPVFFKIDNIEFDHDKVDVKFTTYPRSNLEMAFNFFNTATNYNGEFLDKKTTKLELTTDNELTQNTVTIPLETKSLGNKFTLLVIKNKNILIEKFEDNINNHWKESSEFSNPFHSIFQKYVDFTSLEKMLTECESVDYKSPDKVFERGVSWLLSLLGVHNVILGGYEKVDGGSVSTDILGNLNPNSIILVNVTAGFPKEGDFDKEGEYRTNLLKLLKNKDLEVKSVYFTNKEPTEFEASAKVNHVVLIGRSKIKVMLERLKNGEVAEARKVIQNSGF
jgi:hypothetical protein